MSCFSFNEFDFWLSSSLQLYAPSFDMSDESKDATAASAAETEEENKAESSMEEEDDEGNSSAANETGEDEAASSADDTPEAKPKGKAPAKKAPAPKKKEPAPKKVAAAPSSPKAKPTAAKKSSSGTSSSSSHPTYNDMVVAAIESLKERTGSSRVAILRYIMKNYNIGADESSVNNHVKQALKRGISSGTLKNTTVSLFLFLLFSHFCISSCHHCVLLPNFMLVLSCSCDYFFSSVL